MERKPGFMDTGMAKRIISECADNGICEKVTFHVMGEPTLHKDFFDILMHAAHAGMKVGLTTNGAGLGGGVGQRLLEYPLHQLDVSLQTPTAASFELRKSNRMDFDEYARGIVHFFGKYSLKHPSTIFKFRFLADILGRKGGGDDKQSMSGAHLISGKEDLVRTFKTWAGRVYDIRRAPDEMREAALLRIEKLSPYRWNVVEVFPNVFFETYIYSDWGNASGGNEAGDRDPIDAGGQAPGQVRPAWGGYCFGMRDHFAVLYNGDVVLCCIDYDGKTAFANLRGSTLQEALSGARLGEIFKGFRTFRLVHPYCKRCLGSASALSWVFKPVVSVVGLKLLKPFFHRKSSIFD
jgi:hypothetical protein